MLKSLNHTNILQFIGILVREGKNLVLITEYADGGTLRKTIKNVVCMSLNVVCGQSGW